MSVIAGISTAVNSTVRERKAVAAVIQQNVHHSATVNKV